MDDGPEATLDVVNDLYEVYKHIFYEKKWRGTDLRMDLWMDGPTVDGP